MKRVIREGFELTDLERILTYKQEPAEVQSSNIKEFIERNKDLLMNPGVYFEYCKSEQGDSLSVFILDKNVEENVRNIPEASQLVPVTPSSTDLLGAIPAFVIRGVSSVNEGRKPMNESGWGFQERASKDPRKILDDILKNRDVKNIFSWNTCRVASVKNSSYKGVYNVEVVDNHGTKPMVATVAVRPTMWNIYFSFGFYSDKNDWAPRHIISEGEVDPERLGQAARIIEKALKQGIKEACGY